MPTFDTFMEEIDAAGITIAGRREFVDKAKSSQDWTVAVTDLACHGRMRGIGLFRQTTDCPTDATIDHLLSGYPFSTVQRGLIVRNVLVQNGAQH